METDLTDLYPPELQEEVKNILETVLIPTGDQFSVYDPCDPEDAELREANRQDFYKYKLMQNNFMDYNERPVDPRTKQPLTEKANHC